VRQLSHRSKNLLAVIQSIARQTMRMKPPGGTISRPGFSAALERLVIPTIFSSPTIGAERASMNSCGN
jgi:HWE histidine kinase